MMRVTFGSKAAGLEFTVVLGFTQILTPSI
jgi:hypothetical protein